MDSVGDEFGYGTVGIACLCSLISRTSVGKTRGLGVSQWLEAGVAGNFVLSHV